MAFRTNKCWELAGILKRFQSVPHEKKKQKTQTTRTPQHNATLLETRIFKVKVTPHLQLLRRNVLKTPGKMLSGNEKASCLGRKRSTHDVNEVWKIRLSFDLTMTDDVFLDKKDVVFWEFFPSTIFILKLHAFPIVNQPLTLTTFTFSPRSIQKHMYEKGSPFSGENAINCNN